MTPESIRKQSKQAYRQWCVQWRKYAEEMSKFEMQDCRKLAHSGVGKAILCVGNGYSFEEHIETIVKHHKNVDTICCDKSLGHLLKNGIKPTYCFVADANVNYEKYLQPYLKDLDQTTLLMNVCANPKWAEANWKDRYFFVFRDILGSEKEFAKLSKCPNLITAGTNVSNMMIVVLTQCDNETKQNVFGYDKMILIGYDYSWREDGKYYAFDEDGNGKACYMRHIYGLSARGNVIFASNNLANSASWLSDYIKQFRLPVVQCSTDTLLLMNENPPSLSNQMRYRFKTSDRDVVHKLLLQKNHLEQQMKKIHDNLSNIGKQHHLAHLGTL